MFKKITITVPTRGVAVSSEYTVPQGKVFILTGVMARKRTIDASYTNDSYEWGYPKGFDLRKVDKGYLYISNQLGNWFKHIISNSSSSHYYEGNIIKWKFFLEGETIFIVTDTSSDFYYGGEVTILWEEIDNT